MVKKYVVPAILFLALSTLSALAIYQINTAGPYLYNGDILTEEMLEKQVYTLRDPYVYENGKSYSLTVAAGTPDLSLLLIGLNAHSIYVDGNCIYSCNVEETNTSKELIALCKESDHDQSILVVCEARGWYLDSLVVGGTARVNSLMALHNGLQTGCIGFLLALFLNAYILYRNKRSEKYLVSYMLYILASALLNFSAVSVGMQHFIYRVLPFFTFSASMRSLLAVIRIVMCAQIMGMRIWRNGRISDWFIALCLFAVMLLFYRLTGIPLSYINFLVSFLGVPFLLRGYVRGNNKGALPLLAGYGLSMALLTTITLADRGHIALCFPFVVVRGLRLDNMVFALVVMLYVNRVFASKFGESEALAGNLEGLAQSLDVKVQEKTRELQEEQQQRHIMMTNIFHDLRSPLFILNGCVDLLPVESEQAGETIAIVKDRLAFLTKLTEELFLSARLEDRKVELLCDAVELGSLLKRIVKAGEVAGREKGVDIHYICLKNCTVWGDDTKLAQVFENLVSNAIYYTPAGGTVSVELYKEEGEALALVRDTGKGIAKEELENVFARYYHVSGVEKHESTGLGLSIAAELVKLHYGTIAVESELGKGTIFKIRLPLLKKGRK